MFPTLVGSISRLDPYSNQHTKKQTLQLQHANELQLNQPGSAAG
jgi:hypothetical protein